MPIKDQQTRREYFKNYMAKKRKVVKPESVLLNSAENVKPVKPNQDVKPELVKPKL